MLKNRLRVYSVLFSVGYWMLAGFYFVSVRYFGHGEFAPPDLNYADVSTYAAVVGFSIGLLFGAFPLTTLLGLNKRRSFLSVVFIGTSCYVLFFLTVIFFASLYGNSLQFALSYVTSPEGLITLFHLFVASLLYQFILQINKKFGPGVLLEYTFGKYFAPKAEDRAFMFLDLRSSTQLAETLEHVAYSRLMQDCYAELTEPLLNHRAQVYQYVGDEVVVTWKMTRFFSASLCRQFFFEFTDRLSAKSDYFIRNYGICPQFKAGVHCGPVMVAEVGEIKTEIAYHGDVLNTASRIQNLCNHFQRQLLVSESVVAKLEGDDGTKVEFVAEVELKGKGSRTKVYSITREKSSEH